MVLFIFQISPLGNFRKFFFNLGIGTFESERVCHLHHNRKKIGGSFFFLKSSFHLADQLR